MELEKAIDALKLELKCEYSDDAECQDCGSCPYFVAPQLRINAIEEALNILQGVLDKQKTDPELIREKQLLECIAEGNNLTKAAELVGVSKSTGSRILEKAIESGRVPASHPAMLLHRFSESKRKKEQEVTWKQ